MRNLSASNAPIAPRPSPPRKNRPAWEEWRRLGVPTAAARTIREVGLEPARTFALVRRSSGVARPVAFGLIVMPLSEILNAGLRGGWSGRGALEAGLRGAATFLLASCAAAIALRLALRALGSPASPPRKPPVPADPAGAAGTRPSRAAYRLCAYTLAATSVAVPLPFGRWIHLAWWCVAISAGAPPMLGATKAKALVAVALLALAGATAGREAFGLLLELQTALATRFR